MPKEMKMEAHLAAHSPKCRHHPSQNLVCLWMTFIPKEVVADLLKAVPGLSLCMSKVQIEDLICLSLISEYSSLEF